MFRLSCFFVFAMFLMSSVKVKDIDPVKLQLKPEYTKEMVDKAIKDGAIDREWVVQKINEQTYYAELTVRSHFLKVKIQVEKTHISLTYLESKNLDYDGENIHSKYLNWTRNLMASINKAFTAPPKPVKEEVKEADVDPFEKNLALNDLFKVQDVELAFKKAASSLNWVLTSKGKGKYFAELNIRDHYLKVVVEIDKDKIKITHAESKNLDFDGKSIHSKYFNWVENLLAETKNKLKK